MTSSPGLTDNNIISACLSTVDSWDMRRFDRQTRRGVLARQTPLVYLNRAPRTITGVA
jgi:hypothetical protein